MSDIENRRRKKRNRRGRLLVTFFSVLLVTVFAVRIAELQEKNKSYEKQIFALKEEEKEQKERKDSLQEKEKYMKTKKFVEDYAKDKLGLIYPNEVVFKAEQ